MKEIQISQGFVRTAKGKWLNLQHICAFYIDRCDVMVELDNSHYLILECDSNEEAQKALDDKFTS